MTESEDTKPSDTVKPEEMGRPVPGEGQAIEPEAIRTVRDGALKAGDRMWGPPGSDDTKPDPARET